ncbi:MAG: AIR carboxylase family protein [Alphaproteobacteria bacterium]|nr:AIR carboxylase family protein [Alphaproteobacteria bacterium]
MKIFVVFGSTSDETVYGPLAESLRNSADVECEVISAHRNLEKLQEKIPRWQGDAIVAGAGLAAALPGVVAAMTKLPVFGVPVSAQFGGMDSVASIAQMPPGVPVMTCGAGREAAIASFLTQYNSMRPANDELCFVISDEAILSHPDMVTEMEKAQKLADEKGIKISFSAGPVKDGFYVRVVAQPDDVAADDFALHVPFMPKSEAVKAENYLKVMQMMDKGGLWVGVNNLRNAIQSFIRLKGVS